MAMRHVLLLASKSLYILSTLALVALAFAFVIFAARNIWTAIASGQPLLAEMLSTIGLVIIALAVSDFGRFMLEEELGGDKDLDRTSEVRRTLAKFLTIIIIAASLEALVFIFEAGHSGEGELLWPILLLAVVALMLVCLGLYQRLLHSAEHERRTDKDEGMEVEPEGEKRGRRMNPVGLKVSNGTRMGHWRCACRSDAIRSSPMTTMPNTRIAAVPFAMPAPSIIPHSPTRPRGKRGLVPLWRISWSIREFLWQAWLVAR